MEAQSTPTLHSLPFRHGDFATLGEALDYAAQGDTGINFYTGRGELYAGIPYRELRGQCLSLARKMVAMGLEKGDRVAIIAETNPDFHRIFFACQYAGLVPVALPVSVSLSGHEAYVGQLRNFLLNSESRVALASEDFVSYMKEAAEGLDLDFVGTPAQLAAQPESEAALPVVEADDVSYFQYTSGSTRFPRGVVITHRSVMSNLLGIIRDGLKMTREDRFFSWLPYYHDMGMIGKVLVPVAAQISVDYMDTREFAKRPRQWLRLMSKTKATVSFSPSFGYELCARRLRPGESAEFDLSHWRVAGIGAEMIHPETLTRFIRAVEPGGFDGKAFLACYGMAETSLAISFSPLGHGHETDWIDGDHLSHHNVAVPIEECENHGRARGFVKCGMPLPEFEVEIRDEHGRVLPERHCGTIFVRGQSVMSGYYNAPEETRVTLSEDGWLNTQDMGYMVDGCFVITGRKKDLIIVNGRNVWPQDLEYIAETQPEVRVGDVLAFSVPNSDGGEICVLMVECRETNPNARAKLRERLASQVRREMWIDCHVELVPPNSLPYTSSGKLSRSKARQNFLETTDLEALSLSVAR